MATTTHKLRTPVYGRSPFKWFTYTINGNDTFEIYADWYNSENPNIFRLCFFKISLVTDATVANRYLTTKMRVTNIKTIVHSLQSVAVPASTTHTQLIAPIGINTINSSFDEFYGAQMDTLTIEGDDYIEVKATNGVIGDKIYCSGRWLYMNQQWGMDDPRKLYLEPERYKQYAQPVRNF